VEEEESEGLSWDKVETEWFGSIRFDFAGTLRGARVIFHLFELMHDCGVELVLVGEVFLEVDPKVKCLWAEGTTVTLGKSTEELMVLEVMG
jgi:hypothetical protein